MKTNITQEFTTGCREGVLLSLLKIGSYIVNDIPNAFGLLSSFITHRIESLTGEVIEFDRPVTISEVRESFSRHNLRLATVEELFNFVYKHKDILEVEVPLVALADGYDIHRGRHKYAIAVIKTKSDDLLITNENTYNRHNNGYMVEISMNDYKKSLFLGVR